MHERALMTDLMREIEAVARADGAARVTRVSVRLGALSHFSEEHFREHFVDASRGTLAEGAAVDAVLQDDLEDPRATGVVLELVLPVPSWPWLLSPQVQRDPSVFTATVWFPPTATAAQSVAEPICTGLYWLAPVRSPLPSWP